MQIIWQKDNLDQPLADILNAELAKNQRVIWLVPGGSNLPISLAASAALKPELTSNLVLMQTDERFVAFDDPDCNWHQLTEAGFMTHQATSLPIITEQPLSLEATVERYQKIVAEQFNQADVIIGQFGVGPDGHVAGIKPNTSATKSKQLVDGFVGEDFTRVTLTFNALAMLDAALTYAGGESKRWVFEKLAQPDTVASPDFPAGILNQIANSTLYNDQIGTDQGKA